jgi:4-methylaminobutanoate oxidase (formaldehyde-forming)
MQDFQSRPPGGDLPSSAKVVIVGGGIVGCSVAYHLGKMGWSDVLLLERAKLSSGSTWHAAGLVGQLRTNANVTQLLGYSVALYDRLEAETGLATGWKRNGGLRLACNAERWTEVKRQATTARSFGLEMHLLSPKEAQVLWPLMTIDDVVGAAFLPTDGQASPSDIVQALARGARKAGVTIREDTAITGIRVENGAVRGVETAAGFVACEKLVICAGQWSRALGRMAGVNVPLVSVQHQYVITEPIEGVTPDLPTLRDPDRLTYYKEEVGGLVMGGYESNPIPWAEDGIPEGFHYTLLDPDWDHFTPIMELALPRVPALEKAGIKQLLNGPESFTPDGNFILGEAPEVRGIFVGAGFNAFGIASGGGAGMALAEWVARGEPPYDLWPVDIRRFGRNHLDVDWVRTRTLEAYSKHYTMAWPFEEHHSGRPLRRSPLYERLKAQGAVLGEKLGWERPNWFADIAAGEEPADAYSYGRQNWFAAVGREHRAVRERVAIFDQTSFAKFLMVGRDAEAALSWICANDVAKPPGALTYTQMLNARGGIECDLTVARLAEDRFYIVTGTGFATHDFDWIRRNIPAGLDAHLVDVTSQNAVLSLMGPRARDVLAGLTRDDVSNAAFPFGTCRTLSAADAPVLALRVTYVGELGWELHVPVEFAAHLYDRLMEAGRPHGIANAGYRAMESLRLEKAYRAWGADIGPDHSPLMAGLGWAVKLRKNVRFLGREALEAQRAKPLPRLLAGFTVDDLDVVLLGRETIYRDGKRVGWLSSAGWGYTVAKNIGLGYVRNPEQGVDADYVMSGAYELEVPTERVPAQPFLKPLYDPQMKRVKG